MRNNVCGSGSVRKDFEFSSGGGSGGGIYNLGTLRVVQTSIMGNRCGDGGGGPLDGKKGAGGGSGGGIWNGGTSVLMSCTVNGNTSGNGGENGGIPDGHSALIGGNDGGKGGGICNAGTLALTNCTVATNICGHGGGGGYVYYVAPGPIGGSGGSGGAIWSSGGLILQNCTVAGNATGSGNVGGQGGIPDRDGPPGDGGNGGAGGSGGAIWSSGGLNLGNCTIAGNATAPGGVGASGVVWITLGGVGGYGGSGGAGGSGGGIWCSGNSTIQSCTFSSNFTSQGGLGGHGASGNPPGANGIPGVAGSGGGIYSASNKLQILNTIVANNVTPTNLPDIAGNFLSLGFNLIGNTNGGTGFGSTGDLLGVNLLLGPLADNGGPTFTMALLPGSPAIDAGTSVGAPSTDQRGVTRPQGSNVDIGAYEFISPPWPVVAWGASGDGQWNIPAYLTNVVGIAAGVYHSLALKGDGTVAGWGQNDFGQDNPPAGLSNVTAIAAGWGTSLALKQDGTLEQWGWDGGYGLYSTAHSLSNITSIAACWDCLMALKGDRTVFVWGKSEHGETNMPCGLTNVVAIAGGGYLWRSPREGFTTLLL